MTDMTDLDTMRANLARIRARIADACARSGREPGSVTLLPVSKTFGADAVRQAMALGLSRFGENKVQEMCEKAGQLAGAGAQWAVIGYLQTNKAKDVARVAHEVQSLDRLALAEALDRRLQQEARTLDVLVQVKTSDEPGKTGLAPAELPALLQALWGFDTLRVQGLMTVAVNSDDPQDVRACFRRLRELRDQAQESVGLALPRLSMGMSGDLEIAIEEGATDIRVGSALFGARDYGQAGPAR